MRDIDGWIILGIVLACISTLFLGFGMGMDSVKQEIAKYGCFAVQEVWKEGR